MEIERPFWLERVRATWRTRPIAWLAGVRRSGKTTLAKSLAGATYINCDLPSSRARLSDPETFLRALPPTGILALDEVHQVDDPSRLLKIAADEFPRLRILATGSSTLAATSKFKDSLTGRKGQIHLVPTLPEELARFGIGDLRDRLLRGGLPPALLAAAPDPDFFAEWIDSFYARDIQELFRVEKRQPFIKLLELALAENAGMVDSTRWASEVGLSRPTTVRYLEALETTHAITAIRPFHNGGRQEIVAQPRVYGFDTGFVCYVRGVSELRDTDCGHLLENLVLESLQAIPSLKIHYWRTKQQAEVDFVIPGPRDHVDAIECKWQGKRFDPAPLRRFREDYPKGRNVLVCPDAHLVRAGQFKMDDLQIVGPREFRAWYVEQRAAG